MSDSPFDLDLKLMPDWLKEPADKNPYADYAGEEPGREGGRRGGDRRGPNRGGRDRDGGFQGRRGPGRFGSRPGDREGRGPRRDNRGPRRDDRGPRGDFKGRGDHRPERSERPSAPRPPEVQIPLNIEFLPEVEAVAALAKQIKSSHRAYPLYGMGRMFLNKPERHRVRVTSNAPAYPLYQVGEDGSVTTHRPAAEREAFRAARAQYYSEETTAVEPPKGNFSNVARCRLSGTLLGPTNYHAYQLALRHLYEARFSRRMDFNEFLRQVEVVSDPALVEEWKKQVSTVTVYHTTQEAEPLEFKTLAEVEAHFKAHYLEKVLKSGRVMEMSGATSRNVADHQIRDAIRATWEKERTFPAQTVNKLRPQFQEAGLHIWKHRKRILFVSTVRPVRFGSESRSVSEHVADLLNVIEASPKCTRAEIFDHLLKPHEAEPDFAKLKAAIAADLLWLTTSGHVIEFHDGTFDLPLPPKEAAKEEVKPGAAVSEAAKPETASTAEAPVPPEASPEAKAPATAPEPAAESTAPTPEVPASEAPRAETPLAGVQAEPAPAPAPLETLSAPAAPAPVAGEPVAEVPAPEAPLTAAPTGKGEPEVPAASQPPQAPVPASQPQKPQAEQNAPAPEEPRE